MANLSWNEIRNRATLFARDWSSASREQAEKQTFYDEFFNIFGISRKLVASFEAPVKQLRGTYGFIDLFWKGKLLVEHKSAGASLEAAEAQAFDYIQGLLTHGRGDEAPRYVLLSDFQRFALYDLEPEDQLDLPLFRDRFNLRRSEFTLSALPDHVREFAFIPGYQVASIQPQDDLNLRAVRIMTGVHDALKRGGYSGHDLERLLVRILFCLFAEDTGIFPPDSFRLYIEDRTHPDGSDLGARLNELFATLDKDYPNRQHNLDETLKAFPYVNGALFKERLDFAAFDSVMRKALIDAANFRWSAISPAIFGALFQEVMNDTERRKIGAHYTSERDILKVIRPLFLDKLHEEFAAIDKDRSGRRSNRLEDFRKRLTQLKFLDPACGCGNFLVIAYRELRLLELDVLKAQHSTQQAMTLDEVNSLSEVNVDQFYGIEIEEWPARIAEVAMWLMDHQMNRRILDAFSQDYLRLPLKVSPHIHLGNALRMDWNDLLPASECSYILGNPPFVGKSLMSANQKLDMQIVLKQGRDLKGGGILDYVTAWYLTAARYMDGTPIECAFVSTNSISQGEQPGILWNYIFSNYKISINFAYQTFEWTSEARGKAHVHVVIAGFSQLRRTDIVLFDSPIGDSEVSAKGVTNISPYLMEGGNTTILGRTHPLCDVPAGLYGSKPNDDGGLIVEKVDKEEFLRTNPHAAQFLKKMVSAYEYLNGMERWCIWLVSASPTEVRRSTGIIERLKAIKQFRSESPKLSTRELAALPSLFAEIRQPASRYALIPQHFSQRRKYVPVGFFEPDVIVHNSCSAFPDANQFHFGVLCSSMHMQWTKMTAGRIKSDYRYSNTLVYNNFPWPQNPTDAQRAAVEREAQAVLDARALYPDSTLAHLYDPLLMPPELVKAHHRLDRAVERCYRKEPFAADRERVEFLFALYEQLTAPLLPQAPVRRRRVARPS